MKNLLHGREVQKIVAPMEDPYDWERHCGACDNFGDKIKCPFYNRVDVDTYYEDLNCKEFWDR